MSQENTASPIVSDEPVEIVNPIELIDDVSKNLEILKKLVGVKPKKEKKKSGKPKTEKLPKWIWLKDGVMYKSKQENGNKMELKPYLLQTMIH